MSKILEALMSGVGKESEGSGQVDFDLLKKTNPKQAGSTTFKLLALLTAKGVSLEQASSLTGVSLEALKASVEMHGSGEFQKLNLFYSGKLNLTEAERFKIGADLATGRMLALLADPTTPAKEVTNIAKDLMDRHHGKAVQRVEVGGGFTGDKQLAQIESEQKAASQRLESLLEMRNKVQAANDNTVDAEFTVVTLVK